MLARLGCCLILGLVSFAPEWLYSEQTHVDKQPNPKEATAVGMAKRKSVGEIIKQLQENLARGKEDQSLAVESSFSKKNISESFASKLEDISLTQKKSSPKLNDFVSTPKAMPLSNSLGSCDPTRQDCVFVYEKTNVGEAKKVVEEAAQIDPKALQREIEKLQKNPMSAKLESLKSSDAIRPDAVMPKEAVDNALFVDKSFSTDLREIMQAVREVKRSGATEAKAEVDPNKNLEENKQRQERELSSNGASTSSEAASPELQSANTSRYVDYARDAIQLNKDMALATEDHAIVQDLALPSVKANVASSFNTIKKYDAKNVDTSMYVPVLKRLADMEDFQKALQKTLGGKALNQFNASTVAADLSDEKNISKGKLGLISDIFEESTGLKGPTEADTATGSAKFASGTKGSSTGNSGGGLFNNSALNPSAQVVNFASSANSEDEIYWVLIAKELSSREALHLLKASNPQFAETIRLGRIELDKLIQDLRELYSLGFLRLFDDKSKYNIKADYASSLERTVQMLRSVGKPLAGESEDKAAALSRLRVKKNADQLLKVMGSDQSMDRISSELRNFVLKNPQYKLWRELYLDEFRKIRSEAGLMQALVRLKHLNESSLGTLVYYTFDQMKKQADDQRGKKMVEILRDSNTRNKASVPNDNPF